MTLPIAILVVDDETLARQRIIRLLADQPGVVLAGEAGTLAEARQVLARTMVDLVLLDIHLFGESGFDLVPDLPEGTRVTFVTAYDQHAIRAFEVNALDYLLKPVDSERLAASLARLSSGADSRQAFPGRLQATDRIVLRDRGRFLFVAVREIQAIKAEREYTRVLLANASPFLQRKSLIRWEKELPSAQFARIHRDTLVNLDHIETIVEDKTGLHVTLKGHDTVLPVSTRLAPLLKSRLYTLR